MSIFIFLALFGNVVLDNLFSYVANGYTEVPDLLEALAPKLLADPRELHLQFS